MKEVYMSIELGQLKSILENAIRLQKGEVKTPRTLMGLIDEYNRISSNSSIPNELPLITSFDDKIDIALLDGNLTGSGLSKLTKIISYSEGYINAHTPIPPIINKIEGWSGKKFGGLTGLVFTICAAICFGLYDLGKDIGQSKADPICKEKNDSLQVEVNACLNKLSLSQDSLLKIRENLRNEKNKNAELLSKFNQITVLSDSLEERISFITCENESLKKELTKTRDSLNKCLNHRK